MFDLFGIGLAFKAQQPWHVCFNKPLHPRQASARHAAHEVLSSAQLAGPPSLGRKAPCCLDPQVAPARPGRRQELGPVEVWKRAGRHALNPFTIQKDISMAPAASSTLTPCSCSIPPSLHSVRARALPPRAFRGALACKSFHVSRPRRTFARSGQRVSAQAIHEARRSRFGFSAVPRLRPGSTRRGLRTAGVGGVRGPG